MVELVQDGSNTFACKARSLGASPQALAAELAPSFTSAAALYAFISRARRGAVASIILCTARAQQVITCHEDKEIQAALKVRGNRTTPARRSRTVCTVCTVCRSRAPRRASHDAPAQRWHDANTHKRCTRCTRYRRGDRTQSLTTTTSSGSLEAGRCRRRTTREPRQFCCCSLSTRQVQDPCCHLAAGLLRVPVATIILAAHGCSVRRRASYGPMLIVVTTVHALVTPTGRNAPGESRCHGSQAQPLQRARTADSVPGRLSR